MLGEKFETLMKALEVGNYNQKPSTLTGGAALQIEDLSPVMHNVTFDDSHIKLQKVLTTKDSKSQLYQFDRQLDYGIFGGSAQFEGGIGQEDTSSFVRAVVPMAYYSTVRRVTLASNMVETVDGVKAEDRSANDAAMKLTGDIEFDSFRGQSDFSNDGVYDGNPLAVAKVPGMIGVDQQVRQSDFLSNTQDLMFAEYGSEQTVVIAANGTVTQSLVEDISVRSAMNLGQADRFLLDPITLAAYNKIAHAKERIMLGGSAQEASGANLRRQWTSSSLVSLEGSRFLSGKTKPARSRATSPNNPTFTAAKVAGTSNLIAGTFVYYVSAVSEKGESVPSPVVSIALNAGDEVTLSIANVSGAKYYNVYRSEAGGSERTAKFCGRVTLSGGATTAFKDLGNRQPGSVTGFLIQANTMQFRQLSPYSKLKLAVGDLSIPEAHFKFVTLAVHQPRKNVIMENIKGSLA